MKSVQHFNPLEQGGRDTSTDLPPMEIGEQLRHAVQSLDRLQALIRGADEKIRALFSANTLLAAALALTSQGALPALPGFGKSLIFIASVLMLSTTVGSVIVALFALMPRLQSSGQTSLFFFGDIASQSLDTYQRSFIAMSGGQALEQVLSQTHDISRIASIKFKLMRRAGLLLISALALWFVILVTRLIVGLGA